jgi:DNA replication and repair protein RecF
LAVQLFRGTMHLTALLLEEFRCYRHLALEIPARGLIITGANGSGKSTILEAVAFLATTRSPRAGLDREMIRWESGADLASAPYTRVHGTVATIDGAISLDIALQLDSAGAGGAPMTRKHVKVNDIARRAVDAVGNLRAVVFAPTDLELITGPPSIRRRYLDIMLSQVDRKYIRALSSYTATLAQRNALLKRFAAEGRRANDPEVLAELTYWDEAIVRSGAYVHARRQTTLARLSAHAEEAFLALTEGSRPLAIAYKPSIPTGPGDVNLDETEALAARNFAEALHERRMEEHRRAVSVVGPHRDDVTILHGGVDIAAYGSRGQQRLAVLALKLAEVAVMTEETGDPPIALLDDILSELDPVHRAFVVETITAAGDDRQVLITGADDALAATPALHDMQHARAIEGAVELG